MGKLSMCRICLVKNVRMFSLVNTSLQETYESLTAVQFQVNDLRPSQVCYICYARLQTCQKLRTNCLHSEKLFTEMMVNNTIEPPPLHNTTGSLTIHLVTHLSVPPQDSDARDNIGAEDPNAADPLRLVGVQVKIEDVAEAEDVFDSKDLNTEIDNHNENPMKAGNCSMSNTPENSLAVYIKPEYGLETTSIEAKDQPLTTDNNSDNTTHSTDLIGNKCLTNVKIVVQRTESTDNETSIPAPTRLESAGPTEKAQVNKILQNSIKKYNNKKITKLKQVLMNSGGKINECDKCGRCFTRIGDLTNHKLKHSENPYNCDVCGKSFDDASSIKLHKKIHINDKPHTCDICGRCFKRKFNLLRHIPSHTRIDTLTDTNIKRYECERCGKYFREKRNLLEHIRSHTVGRPYKCKICGKCFKRKTYLTTHIRIHTGVKSHKCGICGKYFRFKSALASHTFTHTGEKPYNCDICGKAFRHKSTLIDHKFVHSVEKPHKCDTCGRSFFKKHLLATHIYVQHMNIKPYKCNICGKCFTVRVSLTCHNRLHTGERFKCNTCGKGYISKRALKSHILTTCRKCFQK